MKKILTSILALLLFSVAAFAQRGLNCYPVFRGRVVPERQMVVTEVRGSSVAAYKLDYYKGISFLVEEDLAARVASLIEEDVAAADVRETEKTGLLLTYALIQPKTKGRIHRYLCYQARPVDGQWKVTILYLEGSATLADLRGMFEKQ
ncbi:MAG: hypothetical protein IKX62_00665 [Bacteroidales bacterium]|nr:hypothetical protein [Bacteroidales bacterium]